MDDLLQQGITAYKAGKREEARTIFITVTNQSPDSEAAWGWLYQASGNDEERIYCLKQILRIDPKNEKANGLLNQLMNFEPPLQPPTSVIPTNNIQNQVPSLKQCPYCAEMIQPAAIVCRFCGRDLRTGQQLPVSDAKPVPTSGTVLKCPSCGSVMGQPDNTGLVQCSYCGTTITYNPPTEKVEQKNIERYLEICNSSLEGKNYDETLQYANKVLEIDPENVNAWINKAVATFWFSTAVKSRFDEAIGYLKKAEKHAPNDERIIQAKRELTQHQAEWLISLGNEKINRGEELYIETLQSYTPGTLDTITKMMNAQTKKMECFNEALNYFLLASSYVPNDVNYHRHRRWL